MRELRSHWVRVLVACAVTAIPASAVAANFPERPIRIVVPYSPGGGTDTIARLIGQRLSEALGQMVTIDNRPGGATNIGSSIVAKAPADGYTLLFGSKSQAVNVSIFKQMPYDPVKDLAPVTLIGKSSQMLVVHPSVPAQSVKDLITLARSRPMQLTYASAGIASAPHLAGELLMMLSGIKMIHVPYKGGSQAMIDVISGQVMMYFSSLPSGLPHVRSGKVRALGLTGSKRSIAAPEIPTLQETGAPGYEISNWYALFVPRATPQAIIARLNTEIVKVLKSDSVQKRVSNDEGMEIVASSPEELAEFLKSEIVNNAKLIRRAGIRAD